MACMCGDLHCWSCGPAQGNDQCIVCGAWADDGCEDPGLCAVRVAEIERAEQEMNDRIRENGPIPF